MEALPASPVRFPRARISATLETDDAAVRRAAIALLGDGGIDCEAGNDLVLLLCRCDAAERLDRIRATLAARPAAMLITALPPDATGATMRRALDAGVRGIVLDDHLATALVPTVEAVSAGQLVVPLALRRLLVPATLSHREKQILALVVVGYTNRQIADELYVAESTVKSHLSSAFGKLDARSRAEAAAIILDPEAGYGPAILGLSTAPGRSAA